MGFLKKFFRNVFHEELVAQGTSSFEMLREDELEAHMKVSRYGSFMLTDAVRPSLWTRRGAVGWFPPRHLSRRSRPSKTCPW